MIVNKGGDFVPAWACAVQYGGLGREEGAGWCVCGGAGGDGDGGEVEEEGQVSCFGGEPTIRKTPWRQPGEEVAGQRVWGLYNRGQNAKASLAVSQRRRSHCPSVTAGLWICQSRSCRSP